MYCSVEDAKTVLNVTGSKYDEQLTMFVESASDWIDDHCKYYGITRPFSIQGETTRTYSKANVTGRHLHTDISFISISNVTNGDGATIASNNYRIEPLNCEQYTSIRLNSGYTWTFDDIDATVSITGKFGYSELPPAPVAEACRMLVVWMHHRYQSGLNASSQQGDFGASDPPTETPASIKEWLKPYMNQGRKWVR